MPKFLDLDKVPMPACPNLAQLRQEIREAPFRFEHPGPSEQMYRQRPWGEYYVPRKRRHHLDDIYYPNYDIDDDEETDEEVPAFHNYIQRPPPQWRPYPSIGQSRNYRSHRPNKSEENKNPTKTNNPDDVNGKVTKDNSNSSSSSGTKKEDEKGSEINTTHAQNVNESQCPNETSLEDVQENKSQSQTANNKVCDTTEHNNALNTEKKSSNNSSESAKQQACSSNQKTVEAKATNSKNAETNGWKQIGMHKNSDELNNKSSTTSSKIKIGFTTPPVQNTVKKITINLKSSCSSALCSSENQTKTVSKIDGISRLENKFDKSDNLNKICDNQSAITNVKIPNNIVNSPSCKELFTKEDKISNEDSSVLESSSGAITQSLKLSKTDSNSKLKEDICKSQTKTKSDILPDVFDIPLLSVSVSTKSDSFADNFDIPLLSQSPVSPETDNQNSALYFTPKSSPSDYSNDKKIQRENVTSAESSQKTDDFLNVRYINTTSTFLCPFGNEMQVVDMVMGSPLKPTKFFYDNGAEIQKSEDDITNALLKEMDNFCNSDDDKDKPTSNIKELVPKPTSENNKTTSNTIVETAKNNVEPKLNNDSLPTNTIKDSTQATENTVLTDSQSEANIQAEIIKIVSQNKKSEDTIKELLLLGDKLSNCEETKDDKSTEKPIKESVTDTATLLSILEEIGDVSEKTTIKSCESPKVAIEKGETSNCKSVTPEPTKENVTLPREEKLTTKTPDSDTKKSKKHKFCGTSQYPDEDLFKCKRKKIVKLDSDTSDEESHSNLQLIKRKKSMLICSSSEEEDNVKKIKRTKNNDTNTTQSESKEKGIDKNQPLLISNSNLPDVSVVLVKLPDPAKVTYLLTKSTSNTNVPPHGNIEDTVSKKNLTESSTKSEHNPSAKNVSTKSTDSSKSSTKREISSQKTPSVISSRRKSSAHQKHSSSLPKLKTDNKIADSASKITPGNDTATKNNTSNKVLHSASKIPHRRKSCATIQNNDSIKKQDESCSINTNVLSDKKPAKGDSSKRRYSSVNEEIASSKTKSSNSHIDDKHRSSKRRSSHSNEKSNLPKNVSVQKIKDSRRESSSSTGSRKSSERSLKSTNRGSSSRSCSPCGTKKAEYLTKAHYEEKRSHTPSLKPIELSIAMTPKKLKTRRKTFDKEVNNQCILQEMSSLEKLRFIFGEDYAESDWCENQEKIKNEKKAARVRNKKKSTETVIQSSTEGDILLECDTLENDSRNFVSEIVITCENFELEATVLEDSDPLEVNLAASDIQIPNESVVESPDTNLESLNIQISPGNVLEHSEANLDPLNNQISSENTLKRPETKLNIKMAKESILEPSDFYKCCPYHTEIPKFDKVNNVNFLQNECTDTVYIFEQVSVSEDIQTITLPPPNSVNDDVVETTPPVPIIDLTDEGEPRTVERPRDMPKIEPEMFETTANETITLYRAEEATDNSDDVQATVASLNANSFLRGNVQTASDVKDEEHIKEDAPNAFEELVKDLHIENKEAPNKPVSEANETTSEQKSRLSESRPHSTHSATTETLAGSSLSSVHDDSELALPTHFIAVANAIESTNNSPQDAGSKTDTNTNLLQQIPNINTREKVSNVRPKSRDQLIAQQRRLSYESVANTNTTSDSGNFNLNNVQNVLSSESSSTNNSKADDTRHLAQQIPKSNTSVSNQLQNLRDQVITQQRRISFESVQSNQITEQRALSRESSSASPNSGNNASTVSNNISILPHNSQRRMSYESQHYVTNTNNTSNVNVGNRQSSLVSQNCLNNTALNNVQNQSNVQRRFSYDSSPIPQHYAANTNALPNSIQSNGPNIDVHRYNQSVSTQRVLSPGTSLISQKVSTSSTFYPPHVDIHTNRQPEQTLLNSQTSQSYGSNTNVNQQQQQLTNPESSRSYSLNSNNVIQQQNNLPGPSRMQETTSTHLELSTRNYLFNSTNLQIHSSLNSNNVVQHRNTNFQPVLQQSTSTSGGSQIIYLLDRDVLAMGAIFAEHIIIYKALHTCLSALRQVQLIMSPNIQIEQGITEDRIKHHANQLSIALLQFNITANTNLNADCSKLIDHIVNVLNSGMYNMIITKSSVCLSMIDLMTPHKNKYITNLFFRSLFDTLTVIKNAMTQRVDSTNANQRQTNEERINNEPPTLRTIAPAQAARNRKAHNTKKTTPRSNVNYPTANNVPQFNRMPMHQPITVPQQSHMQMNVPFGVPPGPIRGPPPSYPYTPNNPVQPQPNIRMQFNTNQNQSNYQQVRTMPPNQLGPQNQVMTQQNIYPYRPNSLQQFNHPNQYRPPTQAQIRPIINNLPNSLNSYRPQVPYRPQTPFINNGSQDFQQQSMYNQNQAFANPYHSRTNLNQQLPSTLVNNQYQQDPTRYGHQSGNQNLQNNVYGMPQAILPPIRPNVMVDSVGNSRVPANNNADLTTPVLNQLLSSCQNILNHTTRSSNIQQRRQSTPEQIQPGQYSTGNFRGNITEQVVTGSYAASTTSIASTSSSLSTHNTTVTQQSTNTVDSIDSTANCLLTQGFTEFIGLRGQRASGNIRVSVLEKEISDSVQINSPLEYNRELGGRIRPSLSESNDQSIDKNPSAVDQIRSSSVPQEAMTSTIEEVNNVSTAENVDQTEPMENVEHTVEQEQTKTPSASAVEDTINSSIVDLTTDDDVVLIEDVKPNHEENHFALNPDQNRTSEISEEASTLNVDPAVPVEDVKQIIAEQDEVASGVDQRRSSVARTVDIVEPMEDIKPYQEQNQVASGVDQQDVSLEEPSTSTSAISINSSVEEHVDLPEHGAGMQQDDVKPNVEQNPVDTIDLTWMDDVDVEELQKDMRFVFVKDEPAEKANAAVEKDVWVPEEQETVYVEKICFCGGDAIYVCICENAFYCSEDCQNQDWENHQNVCHRLRKDKNNSTSKKNEEDAENDEDE